MKKIILFLFVIALAPFNSCKEKATEKIKQENVESAAERDSQIVFPTISFDKVIHDFGEIENGTPVETIFSYTNSGRSPLVVTDIKSTCGCTVPQGLGVQYIHCLLYTSPSPRDRTRSRMPSSA